VKITLFREKKIASERARLAAVPEFIEYPTRNKSPFEKLKLKLTTKR
jgi:hypothetical protein